MRANEIKVGMDVEVYRDGAWVPAVVRHKTVQHTLVVFESDSPIKVAWEIPPRDLRYVRPKRQSVNPYKEG